MQVNKLLTELGNRTADPFESKICMDLIHAIEDSKSRLGKIIIQLITDAEKGKFKEK